VLVQALVVDDLAFPLPLREQQPGRLVAHWRMDLLVKKVGERMNKTRRKNQIGLLQCTM
jgi:hypothetical protein